MFSAPRVTAQPSAWPWAYVTTGPEKSPAAVLNGGHPYGYGKGAFAAALRGLDLPSGASVLLPALVPHRLPEPVRAAGLEPRFYRVRDDLRPDVDDLCDRVDDAAALVGVQYFGFPQSAFGALREVADDEGLVLVDDGSHGALSEHGGRPLGAHGDVGFASLHKLLPVPNGAVLYGGSGFDGGVDSLGRSVASGVTPADYLYASRTTARAVRERAPRGGRLLESPLSAATLAGRHLRRRGSSHETGRPWDVPMSRLTLAYLSGFDPVRAVSRRRARYREWLAVLDDIEGVDPVFESLPTGVCPWRFPAVCADPMRFLATLSTHVAGAFTWPTLPDGVGPRAYPTATRLSRSLVTLPVHQSIPAGRIESLATLFDGWE